MIELVLSYKDCIIDIENEESLTVLSNYKKWLETPKTDYSYRMTRLDQFTTNSLVCYVYIHELRFLYRDSSLSGSISINHTNKKVTNRNMDKTLEFEANIAYNNYIDKNPYLIEANDIFDTVLKHKYRIYNLLQDRIKDAVRLVLESDILETKNNTIKSSNINNHYYLNDKLVTSSIILEKIYQNNDLLDQLKIKHDRLLKIDKFLN